MFTQLETENVHLFTTTWRGFLRLHIQEKNKKGKSFEGRIGGVN